MTTAQKITIATLGEATPQQVFDQVVAHLLTQKVASIKEDMRCAYRGEGGLMCAAGCLIADEEYSKYMDEGTTNTSWSSLVRDGIFPDFHKQLIQDLQSTHDSKMTSRKFQADGNFYDVFMALGVVASQHNLKFNTDEAVAFLEKTA